MKRKYNDPRGPLYKKMTFTQRYETEILCVSCVVIVSLLFIAAFANIHPTIEMVI